MTALEAFRPLELAIFAWLKQTYQNPRLNAQIDSARCIGRRYTGLGFFIEFSVDITLPPLSLDDWKRGRWPIDGPYIQSEGIDIGGDSLLWGTEGYIDCLELVAYGDFFQELIDSFKLGFDEI